MLAAVTPLAFDVAVELAPAGVEVLQLPDGRERAEFLVPSWDDRDSFRALPELERLRVLQVLSAGTDGIDARVPPWTTLCNARGTRDAAVAEWVVGALLGDAYGQLAAAHRRRWSEAPPRELQGSQVLIVGFGSIGEAVSRRLEPFGVTVTGVARRARDGVHGTDELPSLVGRADAVVVLAPLTPETEGLFDSRRLALLAPGTILVNTARAAIVDRAAMLEATHVRAAFDALWERPPAADLLGHDHLVLTPYAAWYSETTELEPYLRAARAAADALAG